jgi:hypothetical protein
MDGTTDHPCMVEIVELGSVPEVIIYTVELDDAHHTRMTGNCMVFGLQWQTLGNITMEYLLTGLYSSVCVSRGVREYRKNIPYAEHVSDHNNMNVK